MISVVIPVYGRAQYLRACVKSLLEQTYRDLEIIVVMDGYSNEIHDIVAELSQEDVRVREVSIPHQGAAAARNAGMDAAEGDLLFFADADDLIPPKALEYLVDEFYRTGADVVLGDYDEILDDGTHFLFVTPSDEADNFNSFLESVTIWNRLYRKEWIQRHRIRFDVRYRADDRIFVTDLFLTDPKISVIHDVVYLWLRHDQDEVTSVTHSKKPEAFENDIAMFHTFMDKVQLRWSEHMHDHMRYSCQYILSCFHQVKDCDEKQNAFLRLKELVARIQWVGWEDLFVQIFGLPREQWNEVSSYRCVPKMDREG